MEAMDEIVDKLNTTPAKISKSQICSNLYYSWRIKEYRGSTEIVSYFARELFQKLHPKWHGGKFWAWLTEEVKNPPKPLEYSTLESLPAQLVPRTKKPVVQTSKSPATSSRPSVQVRPKATPVPTPLDWDSDTDSDSEEEDNSKRRAVKGGLRMTSASKKRKASALDKNLESESTSRGGRKSVNYGQYFYDPNKDIEPESDSDEVDSAQASEEEEEQEDDLDGLPQVLDGTVRIVIHAEKQPTLSPAGPNGTWICDREDCDYVVRAAEEEAGEAKIREHFRQHDVVTEKVALALTEGRRGNMPMKYAYFPPFLITVYYGTAPLNSPIPAPNK
jgi:hypothetical protein